MIPLTPGEGAATTLKDLTASVTLRSSVPCSGVRAGLPEIVPGPDAGVMCAIGLGGGTDGFFGKRSRRRDLPQSREKPPCNHNEADNDLPFEESLGKKDFISDAPFEGPPTSAAIGIGHAAHGRYSKRSRYGRVRDTGTPMSHEAGLKWLTAQQRKDGSWEGRRVNTGLALLAFLGAGQTHKHGALKKTVKRGFRHMKQVQDDDGWFADRTKPGWFTEHAVLTLAMVEIYGMTGSPLFRMSAQRGLNLLADTASPNSAAAVWKAMAFRFAKGTRLTRPDGWKTDVLEALATETPGFLPATAPSTAAATVFARILTGTSPGKDAPIQAWAMACAAPDWIADPVLDHFTGLAMFQVGGGIWEGWESPLVKSVAATQVTERGEHTGSWAPVGPDAEILGRVGTTALACLTLETPIRYGRIRRSEGGR